MRAGRTVANADASGPGAIRRWLRRRFLVTGVRARLLALVFLAAVPVLGVAVFNGIESRQLALEAVRQHVMHDARGARDDLSQGIRAAGYTLMLLSRIPNVMQGTDEGCALLARIAEEEVRYAAFFVADAAGRGICGSSAEFQGMDYSDRDYVRNALATRRLAVGQPVIGRVTRKPILTLAYPVQDSAGNVLALLIAAIDLPWYGAQFSGALISEDASFTVWDAAGRVLYRYPDNDNWVGTQSDAPISKIVAGERGLRTIESVGVDGVARVYGLAHLADYPALGLTVSVGVSKQALFAVADRQYARTFFFLLIAAIVAFGGAYWVGQRLVGRPVAHLVEASRRLGAGDLDVRIPEPYPVGELGALTAAFNESAAAIQGHRVRLEDLVRGRTAELESANRELEAFSYSVSHDLRAPLRHIAGYVELLSGVLRQPLDPTAGRYLRVISDASQEMHRLIEDLLAFARMNRAGMRETDVDMNTIVAHVMRKVVADSDSRGVEWRLQTLPAVQGDPAMIEVLFTNLLDNAVKYSRTREPAVIEVGCAGAEGDFAVIYVRDNGVGFDMRYADKLFGVFQRLHAAEEYEGTGIGLATVRRIVVRHGGRIWPEARPGEGATFFFTLKTTRSIA